MTSRAVAITPGLLFVLSLLAYERLLASVRCCWQFSLVLVDGSRALLLDTRCSPID